MSDQLRRRRVDVEVRAETGVELFGRLHSRFPEAPAGFLDSSDHTGSASGARSRYSILAFSLGPGAQSVQLDSGAWSWLAEAWTFDRAETGSTAPKKGPNSQFQRGQTGHGPPFQLGWVGFVGYESQGSFFRATHAVVIDHVTSTVELQTVGADAAWESLVRQELQGLSSESEAAAASAEASQSSAAHYGLTRLKARDTRRQYLSKISAVQAEIREGNSYEVCLTTAVTGAFSGSPWQAYLQMRRRNRTPFTQYLKLPGTENDVVILSISPERFMQISPEGTLRSEPMKGTRPRGADAEADASLRADLANHPKDRAENVMIADLVRNDLSIFGVPGTLRTERLCEVETYPTVHQMVSTISARLNPEASRARALAAAFPPGSMTGAPKISTMETLRDLESGRRGAYSGVAGYFSTTGASDLSVLIRTAALTRSTSGRSGKGGHWDFHLGLGGAITADSVPEEEWQEVLTKSRGVLGALEAEFPAV